MKQNTTNLFVTCLIILGISVQLFPDRGDITTRARVYIGEETPSEGGDTTTAHLGNYIYNDMENMTIGGGDADCDVYDYQSIRQRVYLQGSGQKVTASYTYKRAGLNSMKFECTASGTQNPDRVELYQENNWQSTYPGLYHDIYNKPHAVGFSVYFPSDFPTPTNWFVFYQVKQHDSNVNPSPNIAWNLDKYGNLDFITRHGTKSNNNYAVRYTKSMSEYKGKWTDFVCEFKITANSDGYCRLYEKSSTSDTYDLVMSYDGMLGYSDCDTTHMEIKGGVYRGQQSLTHTLYQDEIRYGKTKDDVKISGATY